MNKWKAHIIIGLALFWGGGSLLLFFIFLFTGSLRFVNLRIDDSKALWFNTGLSLLFFIQHSGMIRRSFRKRINQFIPEEYTNAFYGITSGVVLFGVVILWQQTSESLGISMGILGWILRLIFLMAIIGFFWGIRALGVFDPFGIRKIVYHLHNREAKQMPFIMRGPYLWIRHPLYFFMLIMIWSCPNLSMDRLLFNILWSIWIFIGSILEECDLINEFGDPYREYQRKVPMLIPLKIFPAKYKDLNIASKIKSWV